MLSPSHPKIHEPPVTGVSPRPMDQRQRQKTAKHEGMFRRSTVRVSAMPSRRLAAAPGWVRSSSAASAHSSDSAASAESA
jgi:hypothetical protein